MKQSQTGMGHVCEGQKEGVWMLFKNDGDAGNDVVVVIDGESECDVSALYREIVGVSRNWKDDI